MKVYAVDYPFCVESNIKGGTREYYPGLNKAKASAFDQFVTQEELEDANDEPNDFVPPHSSRNSAKVYEVQVTLKRSVISALFNGETPKPTTVETLVHEFRYRRGKIVVTNVKAATEPENVG